MLSFLRFLNRLVKWLLQDLQIGVRAAIGTELTEAPQEDHQEQQEQVNRLENPPRPQQNPPRPQQNHPRPQENPKSKSQVKHKYGSLYRCQTLH